MGILANDLKLLLDARARGASFERTLTMGHLAINIQRHDLEDLLVARGLKPAGKPTFLEQHGINANADHLLRLLGAKVTDSLDNSDFEKASIIHDLNQPLPEEFWNQYDCVIDGGTIEHVFNLPVALHNTMQATKVGGRLFVFQMANSVGHGFYSLSPEVFTQALTPEYGFQLERLLGYELCSPDKVYTIPSPGSGAAERIKLTSPDLVFIMAEARKIGDSSNLLTHPPQQHDYSRQWTDSQVAKASPQAPAANPEKKKARKHSFLHDMPWYARLQDSRRLRSRNRKENQIRRLTNAKLFVPYEFNFGPGQK